MDGSNRRSCGTTGLAGSTVTHGRAGSPTIREVQPGRSTGLSTWNRTTGTSQLFVIKVHSSIPTDDNRNLFAGHIHLCDRGTIDCTPA